MGIMYFGLAANFWWLALCFNVFEVRYGRSLPLRCSLVLERVHSSLTRECILYRAQMIFFRHSVQGVRRFHVFFHCIAWGLPAIAVIICLSATVRCPPPFLLSSVPSSQ
jgi:hypothetical protein